MITPLHGHVKAPAGLARPRCPLADRALLSQGQSPVARVISGSVAGAELEDSRGRDFSVCERSSDMLQALISTIFMGWMPCASAHS